MARSTFPSTKHTSSGPLLEVEMSKVHAAVARSTFPSQECQNTRGSDHFLTFSNYNSNYYSSYNCNYNSNNYSNYNNCNNYSYTTTTTTTSPQLQLQLHLRYNYTTLHYTKRRYANYNYNHNYNYATLHYTTQDYTTLHYPTLHYTRPITPLQYDCNYVTRLITLHHSYNSTTLQLRLQLQYTTLHPAVVGEVTTATIATTPTNTTPTTFRSFSGFALPSVIHNNQPLL